MITYDLTTANVGTGISRLTLLATFGFPDIIGGNSLAATLGNDNSPCYVQPINLVSGNNTISRPSSAGAVCIVTPLGNTVVVTLKGVNGDTGVALGKAGVSVVPFDTGVTSFVLNAVAALPGVKLIWL